MTRDQLRPPPSLLVGPPTPVSGPPLDCVTSQIFRLGPPFVFSWGRCFDMRLSLCRVRFRSGASLEVGTFASVTPFQSFGRSSPQLLPSPRPAVQTYPRDVVFFLPLIFGPLLEFLTRPSSCAHSPLPRAPIYAVPAPSAFFPAPKVFRRFASIPRSGLH